MRRSLLGGDFCADCRRGGLCRINVFVCVCVCRKNNDNHEVDGINGRMLNIERNSRRGRVANTVVNNSNITIASSSSCIWFNVNK